MRMRRGQWAVGCLRTAHVVALYAVASKTAQNLARAPHSASCGKTHHPKQTSSSGGLGRRYWGIKPYCQQVFWSATGRACTCERRRRRYRSNKLTRVDGGGGGTRRQRQRKKGVIGIGIGVSIALYVLCPPCNLETEILPLIPRQKTEDRKDETDPESGKRIRNSG
eukprot:scaffold141633_cov31-Tisochrysis_lutea.AAC.9